MRRLVAASLLVLSTLSLLISACAGEKEKATPEKEKAVTEKEKTATEKGEAIIEKKEAIIELEKGGKIVIELFPEDAPNTVDNFVKLATSGFYDSLTFHRVVPGFVVQGGDPKGDGTGGPGYRIDAEFNDRPHLTGTVAMARGPDPNSAGCQFYICLAPQPHLDGNYTVFGQVVEGMESVQKIQVGDRMRSVSIVTGE